MSDRLTQTKGAIGRRGHFGPRLEGETRQNVPPKLRNISQACIQHPRRPESRETDSVSSDKVKQTDFLYVARAVRLGPCESRSRELYTQTLARSQRWKPELTFRHPMRDEHRGLGSVAVVKREKKSGLMVL